MKHRLIIALSFAVVAGAFVQRTVGNPAAVSTVVYPAQSIPLTFSHEKHLALGARCTGCHVDATTSKSALDNLIPRESACARCHAIERDKPNKVVAAGAPAAACVACHKGAAAGGPIARVSIPAPNLKFSHSVHAEQGVSCEQCHGDLQAQRVGLATRAQLPAMRSCMGCHDGRRASDRCTTCHFAAAGGFVKTEHASGVLKPSGAMRGDQHGPMFAGSHGAVAQNDATYCNSCHQEEFCSGCHRGIERPMSIHSGDYVARHAIDAVRNQPNCSSCHRRQTFCVGCHARVGLDGEGRGGQFVSPSQGNGERFHPPGWVEFGATLVRGTRSPNHHAFAAQRNISECASCHRETFCSKCHSRQPGSFSVNPHPRTWLGSRRCRSLLKRNARMCSKCHINPAELSCDIPITSTRMRR